MQEGSQEWLKGFLYALPSSGTPCAIQERPGLLQGPVSGPTLAGETLVPGPPPSCLRPTLALASQGRPSLTGRGPNLASEPGCNAVMGLAPPQSIPQDLSEAVLETINNARAPSI